MLDGIFNRKDGFTRSTDSARTRAPSTSILGFSWRSTRIRWLYAHFQERPSLPIVL
jgi:hypothetical protein